MTDQLYHPYRAETPCALCNERDAWIIGLKDRHGKSLRTLLCQQCGLGWTDPQPTPEAVQSFYETTYRTQYKGSWKPKPKHVYRAAGVALTRYRALKSYLQTGSSILDLGAGGGEFLYLMRHLGLDIHGIEPNRGYGEYARDELGLPIDVRFVDESLDLERTFDIATIFHVLEHLQKPIEKVQALANQLRDGGLLIIEVPNLEERCHAPNNTWHFAHLYHYNAVTLQLLGERAGLQCVDSFTSDDGGNITAIFSKGGTLPTMSCSNPENAHRILAIRRQHSLGRYLLNPKTCERLGKKFANRIQERFAIRKEASRQELLEQRIKVSLSQ